MKHSFAYNTSKIVETRLERSSKSCKFCISQRILAIKPLLNHFSFVSIRCEIPVLSLFNHLPHLTWILVSSFFYGVLFFFSFLLHLSLNFFCARTETHSTLGRIAFAHSVYIFIRVTRICIIIWAFYLYCHMTRKNIFYNFALQISPTFPRSSIFTVLFFSFWAAGHAKSTSHGFIDMMYIETMSS